MRTQVDSRRLGSLDALRGFDMIWIIGLEQAMRGLCVLFPGGQDWWFKRQFHHVPWDGLAFYDTIFVESLGVFVLCWLTCWFLHRHKIHLKV